MYTYYIRSALALNSETKASQLENERAKQTNYTKKVDGRFKIYRLYPSIKLRKKGRMD